MKLKMYTLVIAVLVLLLLAGAGFYVWYLLQPTDEELIRESVTGIEAALSAPFRNDLQGQAEDMAALKQYLGEEVRIELPCYRYTGKFSQAQVLGDYFAIRKHLRGVKATFTDVVITFPEDREKTAIVNLTVHAAWRKLQQHPYAVKVTMSKETGDWLVTGITFLDNIRTPGQQ